MAQEFTVGSIADIENIESIPIHERVKDQNTYAADEKGATLNADGIALSFLPSGETYDKPLQLTYRELIQKIRQCANMFYDLGVGPNDVVTFLLPNIPQTHFVLWGAEIAGIVNPINPLWEPATIRDLCNAAQTKVLVALGELPGTEIWHKVAAIKDEIPSLRHILKVMGTNDVSETVLNFDQTLEKYPGGRLQFDRGIRPDDVSSLYHTGGTTGTPKLAQRTHFNEVCMAWMLQVMGGIEQDSTIMCGLPLFHVNATSVTGLAPFYAGAHVVLLSPAGFRDPSIIKNFYKIVETCKANTFSTVPTALSALMEVPVGDSDISSLQYVFCGAAPLSVEVFERFEKHTGMKILEGYGLTEGACASAINPRDGDRKAGSIGIRVPCQQMKSMILGEDGKYVRDAAPNEIGAVVIKGPNVFKGYLDEDHNKGAWVDEDWFNTGDLDRQDENGCFWLTGREKELIIRDDRTVGKKSIG